MNGSTHETSDTYKDVVAHLVPDWRVVLCKDGIQWILQCRKKGGAERPWRSAGYFTTKSALLRLCASSCGQIGPSASHALAALPERARDFATSPEKSDA